MNLQHLNFYSHTPILQQEQQWQTELSFNAEHEIFMGHFPGQPVVPGVCLMQIVKESIEAVLQKKLFIKAAPQIKFLQLITPDVKPVLAFRLSEQDNIYVAQATLSSATVLSKITLLLGDAL